MNLAGSLVRLGDRWMLLQSAGAEGPATAVTADIPDATHGRMLITIPADNPGLVRLREKPPLATVANDDMFGAVIHGAADSRLVIVGADGRGGHCGVLCDPDLNPLTGRLVPIRPENENYRRLLAAFADLSKRVGAALDAAEEAEYSGSSTGEACSAGTASDVRGSQSTEPSGPERRTARRGSKSKSAPVPGTPHLNFGSVGKTTT